MSLPWNSALIHKNLEYTWNRLISLIPINRKGCYRKRQTSCLGIAARPPELMRALNKQKMGLLDRSYQAYIYKPPLMFMVSPVI